MNPWVKKHWFKLAAAGIIAILVGVFLVNSLFKGSNLPSQGAASDFELESIYGDKVSLQSTDGKVRLFYFFYSFCPDVCLPTTAQMSQIQDGLKKEGAFGTDTNLISITIDPERDTAQKLQEFSSHFRVDKSGWYFLRGEKAYTKDVALKYGVSVLEDDQGNFAHQNIFTLVDKEGNIRKRYILSNESFKIEDVVKDMVALSKE